MCTVLKTTSNDAMIGAGEAMRTTIALDDDLINTAQDDTGLVEKSALVREALKALIEREAARRLAELGVGMGRSLSQRDTTLYRQLQRNQR
jgi:Arc/MetJ family transcription regulator